MGEIRIIDKYRGRYKYKRKLKYNEQHRKKGITEKVSASSSRRFASSQRKNLGKEKMTEEEVAMEMEAVEAVYGEDCDILDSYPPHLHLHIKPRTAEISSQQVFFLRF